MLSFKNTSAIVALMLTIMFALSTNSASAQVPQTLNYQGYLTDSAGQALLDPVVVEFSIYSVETGGTPLWSEFQNVFPAQGLFSTSFGSTGNPFPPSMFDTPLYLGVKVSVDPEMTPRTPLSASAYSLKAEDAQTLGGMTPASLDQSAEVNALQTDLATTQGSVSALETSTNQAISSVQTIASDALASATGNQNQLNSLSTNVTQNSTDLNTAENDIAALESSVATKQNRVNGVCLSGSSIRAIDNNGNVTCEPDDASLWRTSGPHSFLDPGLRVGLGSSSPAASIQIDAPAGTDPFRARVSAATKLRVHANGSVSVGTATAGLDNGMYVFGSTGMGTNIPNAKLDILDDNWQLGLDNNNVGGDDWFVGSSADAWAIGGGKFIVSTTDNSNSHALVIDSSKEVGLGTSDPQTRLHVAGGVDVSVAGGGFVTVGSVSSTNIAMDNNEIMARSNGSAAVLALNAEGGEVTVNANGVQDDDALRVVGRTLFTSGQNSGLRMSATNSNPTNAVFEPTLFEEGLIGQLARPFWRVYSREFFAQTNLQYKAYSDRSLKKKIAPIGDAVKTIQALEGVSYAMKENPMGKRARPLTAEEQFVEDNQLGFIAQDVAEVLPQLVTVDESSGLHTVAYLGVIPVLVEALKEQQVQIEQQRTELEALKARLK